MKLFRIDEYKIFEDKFQDMKVGEFLNIDEVPKGVNQDIMVNLTEYIKNTSQKMKDLGVEDVEDKTLFEVMMFGVIDSGEMTAEEVMEIANE